MSDIVERLNAAGTALTQDRPYASAACLEAAATITALREEVERLTARCSELRGIIYLTPDNSSGSYLLMQRAIPPNPIGGCYAG